VDMEGNNPFQIKSIGVAISTFATLPVIALCVNRHAFGLPV
jgi:hypothetical protein